MEKKDPRHLNEKGPDSSLGEYLRWYAQSLAGALESVEDAPLNRAFELVREAARGNHRIFVAGNGGSASIADHLCCDFTKGTFTQGHPPLRTHSFSSHGALLTAIANDFGYDRSFAFQVETQAQPGDILILISSSGNSENIVAAAASARKMGIRTIGFSGFKGGKLAELSDVSVYVPFSNYGIVEDAHQALMHVFTQFLNRLQEGH